MPMPSANTNITNNAEIRGAMDIPFYPEESKEE
jgi:hypothetical protein